MANTAESSDEAAGKRSCTDVFCLLLFIMVIGGMCFVTYSALDKGDPYRLLYGTDSWGNTCNRDNAQLEGSALAAVDLRNKKRLLYFTPSDFSSSVRICVSACNNEELADRAAVETYARANNELLCRYDYTYDQYATAPNDVCPATASDPYPETKNFLNRCVPKEALDNAEQGAGQVVEGLAISVTGVFSALEAQCDSTDGTIFEMVGNDLEHSAMEIVYLCLAAVGVALAMAFLMQFLAAVVVWVLVLSCALGAILGTAFCWYTWYTEKSDLDEIAKEDQTEEQKNRVQWWLIYAAGASAVALIVLLVLLVMRKRIALVVQLFREAGKAIWKMPFLLIQPFITLVILLGSLAAMVLVLNYVQTSGSYTIEAGTNYATFVMDDLLKNLRWVYLFGLLWVVQFIIACYQMTVAGAVCIWYFTRNKKTLGWPILKSIGRLIRYHLGSVAFGSFIIALIQMARIVLEYIDKKCRLSKNKVAQYIMCVLKCCLWLFEKIMKFINKNAYIVICMKGCNFCSGCRQAFRLILDNIMRVAAVNSVGAFCLFLGKLGVAAITAFIGVQMFKDNKELCYVWSPIIVGSIFAFLIAHVFLSVYGMTIDTILLCFCEDSEQNDGITKPYFMSKGLMSFVHNADKVKRLAEQPSDPALAASKAVSPGGVVVTKSHW